MELVDKIKGCLFGGVYGDTLGSSTEGMTPAQISQTFGRIIKLYHKGWTDDTEMTLALITCLNRNHNIVVNQVHACYVERYLKFKGGYSSRTRVILDNLAKGYWLVPPNVSNSNGCVMRIAPIGLLAHSSDFNRLKSLIEQSIHYTHSTIEARDVCMLHCYLIHQLVYNLQPDEYHSIISIAVEYSKNLCNSVYSRIRLIELALKMNSDENITTLLLGNKDEFQIRAIDALCCSIYLFLKNLKDPLNAVIDAANLGGDTDTIAKITGDLCGAAYGTSWIPQDFKEIENVQEVYNLVDKFAITTQKMNESFKGDHSRGQ